MICPGQSIPRLFADDTWLLNCDPSLFKLQEKVNHDLNNVEKWCKVNKVTINPEKSIPVIIPLNLHRSHSTAEVTFMVNNAKISPCRKAKYLGLIIDHNLNFQPHILSLEKNVS